MGHLSAALISAFGRRHTTGNGVSRRMEAGRPSQQPCIVGCDLSLGHLQCGSAISVQLINDSVSSSHPRLLLASNSILHDFRLLISSQGIENGGVGKLISEDWQNAWVSAVEEGGGGIVSGMDGKKCVITLRLHGFLENGIVGRAQNGVVICNEIWDYLYDPF